MSTLQDMLAAQDDAALSAAASPGLLRRAKTGLDKPGAVKCLQATDDHAELQVEGYTVKLDKDGPLKARCDCPATGICRHILTAVLHLRQTPAPETGADAATARAEIAALSLQDIQTFAGSDWPEALRIAVLSSGLSPQNDGSSCVVVPEGSPGPVTFVRGGGLRKALFKGSEARRKRFVAAAALVLGKHDLPIAGGQAAAVESVLLEHAGAAVTSGLQHGLRGDPALAQDRLFDVAVSARADAAPRLAAMLRTGAHYAGQLGARAPEADPVSYLSHLAACHALIRALQKAPDDPLLTGQLRRDYVPAASRDLAVLGVCKWRSPAGARGLTIHGWDGERFLATGPARAAGADPGFSPAKAYQQLWWPGLVPARMAGMVYHLPEPRMSHDGLLPRQTQTAPDPRPLVPDDLPFHSDWQAMRAEMSARMGIGLRAAMRPLPLLIRDFSAEPPRFDEIEQRHVIDLFDKPGRSLVVRLPDDGTGRVVFDKQRRLEGALLEAIPEADGIVFRLISLYLKHPLQIWNVTVDQMPAAFSKAGTLDRVLGKVHRSLQVPKRPERPDRVASVANEVLQALCDGFIAQPDDTALAELVQRSEALGLSDLARGLRDAAPGNTEALLMMCWKALLIRRAAMRS